MNTGDILQADFLAEIGINIDDATRKLFNTHFANTLLERVIESVIDSLNDTQLEQFNRLKDGSGEELWQWVRENVSEIDEIIQEETDIILGEIAENSESI